MTNRKSSSFSRQTLSGAAMGAKNNATSFFEKKKIKAALKITVQENIYRNRRKW